MELVRPSLWSLLFFFFCLSDPVSVNAEDKRFSSPASLKELKFLKGVLEHKAEGRFRHEGLWKEPNHMKGAFEGRILKVGAGAGKGATYGRGYRRPPSKVASSTISLRFSGTFPLLLKYLFPLCLLVFLLLV